MATAKRRTWGEVRAEREREPGWADAYVAAELRYQFGKAVREARSAAGMTQADLAAKTGTTQAAIARLEAGGVEPRISTVMRLAAVLGRSFTISGDGLAQRDENPKRHVDLSELLELVTSAEAQASVREAFEKMDMTGNRKMGKTA